MLSITLKSTWAHKRRLTGTVLAVVVGIAFLAGTLVLGDAMRAGFDDLFTEVYAGTDAVVRGEDTIGADTVAQQALLDRSVVADVAAVDGVAAAVPYLVGVGQIVGADGAAIGGDGPPALAGSWIEDPELNPYGIVEGRAPAEPGEVAIDRASAEIGGLEVGGSVVVRMPASVEARIVGPRRARRGADFGGVSFAAFILDEAQRHLAGGADVVSQVIVAADDGVTQDELVQRLLPIVPDGAEAVSGTDLTDEATEGISADFLDFFETFLLAFAGIALLVAGFSIYNTFSITLAQRSRESALLRALGSSSGQLLASVALEAVIVGVVASAIGVVAGLGLAAGLAAVLGAVGFGIPTAAMSLDGATVAVSLGVGVVVTVLAAATPAVRASRVAPLAVLRDVAIDRSGVSLVRAVVGGVLTAAGAALVVVAALGTDGALAGAAAGAALTIVGVVTLGPVVARPLGRALGAPLRSLGITGSLARENAARNPRRTAGTASALMVGVAVVTIFTVVAASIEATIDDAVTGSVDSDLVVTAGGFSGSGLTPQLAAALSDLDEVETAVGVGLGAARIDGEEAVFSTADPAALAEVMDIEMVEGSLTAVGARWDRRRREHRYCLGPGPRLADHPAVRRRIGGDTRGGGGVRLLCRRLAGHLHRARRGVGRPLGAPGRHPGLGRTGRRRRPGRRACRGAGGDRRIRVAGRVRS